MKLLNKVKYAFAKLKTMWIQYKTELKATVKWDDVLERSFKTFIQIAVTYAFTALAGVNFSKELSGTFWIGFLLSAGSAGISATWNTVLLPVLYPGKTKTSMDDYLSRLAIERAKTNSNAQPDKEESNG